LGTFDYVPATFVWLAIASVNRESTSCAIVITSGNSKLKSSALSFLCNIPKRVTCNIRESCTSMAGVQPCNFRDGFALFSGVVGCSHIGITANQRGKRIGLGMPHGANHGKTITGIWQMQVCYERVERLCRD